MKNAVVCLALIVLALTVNWKVTSGSGEHHGVDEICKAFPAPQFPRPLSYTVRLPDGQPLATGACQ